MMSVARVLGAFLVAAFVSASMPQTSSAQGLSAIRKKAEDAKKKLDEEAAKKAAADSAAKQKAADSSKAVTKTSAGDTAKAGAQPAPTSSAAAPAKADPKVWENYDFVPGSKVLFYTDFADDRAGNFARGLKYVGGPAEVIERDDVKMLRSTGRSEFLIPVGGTLPARFTLEIDVIAPTVGLGGYDYVAIEGGPDLDRGEKSAEVNWAPGVQVIIGGGQSGKSEKHNPEEEYSKLLGKVTHLRILMDSAYFKMYENEKRIYNIPDLPFKRDQTIRVLVKGGEEANQATFITGIRLAESETDVMYDALSTKGRWMTQGILFATGKTDLQPESRPVLKEIASTMKKYGDLRILIEGHTDNVGSAPSNLALSEGRAAAVKAALVAEFGVSGDRITTKGFGDTKPSVPNTSAAGRAQNRRVEIVKQ
jgi:outer membrane protein OmpA-like peptidoglycan-associated protein